MVIPVMSMVPELVSVVTPSDPVTVPRLLSVVPVNIPEPRAGTIRFAPLLLLKVVAVPEPCETSAFCMVQVPLLLMIAPFCKVIADCAETVP